MGIQIYLFVKNIGKIVTMLTYTCNDKDAKNPFSLQRHETREAGISWANIPDF